MNREQIMQQWDLWRESIAGGSGASWHRDEFEELLDSYDEEIAGLKAKLAEVEKERDSLRRVELPTLTEANFRPFCGRFAAYRTVLNTLEWLPVASDIVALINKERGV